MQLSNPASLSERIVPQQLGLNSQCLCLARPKNLSDVLREDTMLTNINVQEVLHQQTIGDLAASCSFGCSCAKAADDVFNDADTGEMQQLAVSKATRTLSYVSYLLRNTFQVCSCRQSDRND